MKYKSNSCLTRTGSQTHDNDQILFCVLVLNLIEHIFPRYNNKSYRVDDIDRDSTPKSTFTNSRGETVTFAEYYHKQYGLTIKDLGQPLLVHRPKVKSASEVTSSTICLIPELCNMTGLTNAMRDDFRVSNERHY